MEVLNILWKTMFVTRKAPDPYTRVRGGKVWFASSLVWVGPNAEGAFL